MLQYCMKKRNYKEIVRELKERGYTLSMARIAILRYVMKENAHYTAEEIYKDLKHEYPTLSIATVYNTLKLLSKEGYIQQIMIDPNKVIYDSTLGVHPHFYCKICGKIEDISSDLTVSVNREMDGNRVDEVHIYVYGICKDCLRKEKEGNKGLRIN